MLSSGSILACEITRPIVSSDRGIPYRVKRRGEDQALASLRSAAPSFAALRPTSAAYWPIGWGLPRK
jgi:hypothetical protein